VNDIAIDEEKSYEDWWVHPAYARNSEMASKKNINFAWNYFMKERT
jgi:hypothetical protein